MERFGTAETVPLSADGQVRKRNEGTTLTSTGMAPADGAGVAVTGGKAEVISR